MCQISTLMARLQKFGNSTLVEAETELNSTESSCAIFFANEALRIFVMSLVAMGKVLLSFLAFCRAGLHVK